MVINLGIQANIIDLRTDTPKTSDIFLVDTNAWLWQTYPQASSSSNVAQKAREYSSYLLSALSHGATLTYSGLILAELAHVIEKTEREIYNRNNGLRLKSKEYRHNYANERTRVVAEIQSAWSQVEAIAIPLNLTIDDQTTHAALTRLQTQALDGYDLLMLEAISRAGAGHVQIITDDMDYAIVPGIQIFTSNLRVIQTASRQGKLLIR